jgi:15-cis-phytoene synthase
MIDLFHKISNQSSAVITKNYSTSFSLAVRLLAPSIRQAIYNIYGFVRIADEIVDSFEDYPQEELLDRFEEEYWSSLKLGISTNPVIHAFLRTVKQYQIDDDLVRAFLKSMRADLTVQVYENQSEIDEYIYGSADVVGLMCLKVFVKGDQANYDQLKGAAMKLGSAFQKVNFLRDFKQDYENLDRTYFPELEGGNIKDEELDKIIPQIRDDFKAAFQGIKKLPKEARFGVYVAYKYYHKLLRKIDHVPAHKLKEKRIRVSNPAKTVILLKSYVKYQFNLL